jgi:predicted site-specific integrase-resolvase
MRQQAKELTKVGLLTVAETARRARVATRTVYAWMYSGKIETVPVGNLTYVRESSLTHYLGKEAAEALGLTYSEK